MQTDKPMIDIDGEVRPLTHDDIKQFKPAAEVLPSELFAGLVALQKTRGLQKKATKISTTIRFDADVLAALRASGKGWQSRVNQVMRDWLKSDSAC